MATRAVITAAPTAAGAIAPLSWFSIAALHLVPGALTTVGFVVIAPLVERVGFPPIAALLAAIVVVLVPFELAVVASAGSRGRGIRDAIGNAVPYRRPLPRGQWLWLVPALIVAAFVGFGIHASIEPAIITRLFGWLPEWFVTPIVLDRVGDYSATAWIVTLVAYLVINGFVGPIVEEVYFRGYLLPRMAQLGRWAPLVNVSLFSLYHFWSPWQLVARILGVGPTVYAVQHTRNIYLGMVVHSSLNSLGVVLLGSQILARL